MENTLMNYEGVARELDRAEEKIKEIDKMISNLESEKRQLERRYRYYAEIIKYGEPSQAMKKVFG